MALFQEAIVKKHLKDLDPLALDIAYNEYLKVYSTEKIKNIRIAKEEQYQEGFIKDIFGSVLGYSVYPESPYNIETEKKNEGNARKADGAILKDEKVVGVIELKDNKTKNLDTVKDQAFGYKNNHKECSYVISSNFHKLRFYIDDATDYEEFDLYNLDKESFKRFYLYLRKEGLLDKNIPKLLRQETKFHEEEISKKLYKDYSNFKGSFFENALKNNPQFDRLALFKKSQKFLDRVLFVLFAEDKGLISTNSVVQIVEKWQALRDDAFDTPRPLYALVLLFFNNLYLGKKDNNGNVLIPEFGGELFAPDEVLDQLTIDDDVLKDDLLKLSQYDFNTDVDVNILGHIFEHSLNEVDDVEAELRGEQLDKTKSKRKKDGVFYTPKYITKYIVDNTLGKLCSEKKSELKLDIDIFIDDFQKTDGKLNEKGKDLFERLNTYKSWLLTVKVCDPACGSGAFLNQALSFFIEEHKFVDDLIAELTNSPLRLFDTDLQILENNIYGVDINEESVEIAKLSLWLRTAQPGRKLSNLSNNIKCGNSLIDDPEVAGDKAFNWGREFPSVFIEKNKFAFHITTSLHDSRTSSRMLEFKVRERRFDGSKPNAEVNPLTKEEEELIATTVSEIAKEDDLNIAAFNLCWDHMHILLVCEEAEISSIMQKIKAKTARAVNILRGITKVVEHGQTSPNKGAGSLDEILSADSRNKGAGSYNKGAGSYNKGAGSYNKGAGSLDDTENTGSHNKGAGSLDDSSAVHRIDTPRGEKQNSLWTQKFGCKPIVSDEQFWNTVHYIENNKEKHKLPRNPKLETIISRFVKTYEDCLKTEYTGGFDVVIGNPPYVSNRNINAEEKPFYTVKYSSAFDQYDLYVLFMELSQRINKSNGYSSFILPDKFLISKYGVAILQFLSDKIKIEEFWDLTNQKVFPDASVYPVIYVFKNTKTYNHNITKDDFKSVQINKLTDDSESIIDKIGNVEKCEFDVWRPLSTSNNLIEGSLFCVSNSEVNRYHLNYKEGRFSSTNFRENDIQKDKILIKKICYNIEACIDFEGVLPINTTYCITSNDRTDLRYVLTILNSNLMSFFARKKYINTSLQGGYVELRVFQVKDLPIISSLPIDQIQFIKKADSIINLNKEYHSINLKFLKLLRSDFQQLKTSKKIENWQILTWDEFESELKKLKTPLFGIIKDDWFDRFERFKKQAIDLKSQIDQTDAAIDRMVYELYGLTEEEIQIVENS
jgi:REP element-mobilizing transposase RayT